MTQLHRIETTAFYVKITVLRSLDFLLNLCLQKYLLFDFDQFTDILKK